MYNFILFLHLLIWLSAGIIYSKVSGWPFELFTHWIVTWIVTAAILLGVAIGEKQWVYSISALILTVALSAKLLTGYAYDTAWSDAKPEHPVTLAQWNIYNGNDYVFRWIESLKGVDVVVLNEVKPWVRDRIADNLPEYPYKLLPEGLAPDTVIISKLSLLNTSITPIEGSPRFILKAEIEEDGKRFVLLAAHTTSPSRPARYARRVAELKAITAAVQAETLPVAVVGDLNITPYSPDFKKLMQETQLALPAAPLALPVTWPSILALPGFGLPIDHMLSKGLAVYSRAAPDFLCCSDHRPVVTRFKIN
ncbi:MAG: endonuclease/exonuclease/phosphatase family protein [Rickettsiales bacterium]